MNVTALLALSTLAVVTGTAHAILSRKFTLEKESLSHKDRATATSLPRLLLSAGTGPLSQPPLSLIHAGDAPLVLAGPFGRYLLSH